MLIWFLAFCMIVCAVAGCKQRVVYLKSGQRMTHVSKGAIVPADSWLVTEDGMAEIFDAEPEELKALFEKLIAPGEEEAP